jgi:UDP-N-acetyl-D-galactosamine dehydrogenase
MKPLDECRLGVVGLGYVGLPLAIEFGKQFPTIGFDINARRIAELKDGRDRTLEVTDADIRAATQLNFSDEIEALDAWMSTS